MIDLHVYDVRGIFFVDEYASAIEMEARPYQFVVSDHDGSFRTQYDMMFGCVPLHFYDKVVLLRGELSERVPSGRVIVTPTELLRVEWPSRAPLDLTA